jgi:hypothetical protein
MDDELLGSWQRSKSQALRAQLRLSLYPDESAEPFWSHPELFDAEDRLQVRCDMSRTPSQERWASRKRDRAFGVSRQTFYILRPSLRGAAGHRAEL